MSLGVYYAADNEAYTAIDEVLNAVAGAESKMLEEVSIRTPCKPVIYFHLRSMK